MRILLTAQPQFSIRYGCATELVRVCCKVYVPQAVECNSKETVLPEIVLALAVSRNWLNADFIDGTRPTRKDGDGGQPQWLSIRRLQAKPRGV